MDELKERSAMAAAWSECIRKGMAFIGDGDGWMLMDKGTMKVYDRDGWSDEEQWPASRLRDAYEGMDNPHDGRFSDDDVFLCTEHTCRHVSSWGEALGLMEAGA